MLYPTSLAYASSALHPRTSRADEAFNYAVTRVKAFQKSEVAVRGFELSTIIGRDIHALCY